MANLPQNLKERAYFGPFRNIALNWGVHRSVILMGPRRVGKTVMLGQLIRHVLSEGFPASRLFLASVDTPLYSGMALERILALFEKQSPHDADARRMVIFDEIQYLKDWEVHLKTLTDRYPHTRFIASGSAAAALPLRSRESGAGRFTEFHLPPLTFSEFLDFRGVEDVLIRAGRNETQPETDDINQLNHEFIGYLNHGGYPEAVLNEHVRQDVTRHLGRDIIDKVLLRDLPSLYGIQDIQELNRLFTTIAYHSGREINLEGLASNSGVRKNTIGRYLEYLEAAFLIIRVRRVDDSGRTFQRNRQFKAYLVNPSMRTALLSPIDGEDPAMGKMAETAVFSQWSHSDLLKNIFYARWKNGRHTLEIDLVALDPSEEFRPAWAVEVKWSDRSADHPEELEGLVEFGRKNRLSTDSIRVTSRTLKTMTRIKGIEIEHIPCALLCYRIGKNATKCSQSRFPGPP